MNVTGLQDFEVKCKKCGSISCEVEIDVRGGCPSCGPETELQISCNNCHHLERTD